MIPRYLPEDDGPPERPRIPESAHQLPAYRLAFARERFEAQVAEFSESMRPRLQAMGEAIRSAADSMSALGEQLRQAGLRPDAPPDEPRARALWLQQHRNTGPARKPLNQSRRAR